MWPLNNRDNSVFNIFIDFLTMGWNGVPNSESTPYVEPPNPLFASFCTSFYVIFLYYYFYWTIHLLKYYQQDKNECFSHHVEGRATHQPIQPNYDSRGPPAVLLHRFNAFFQDLRGAWARFFPVRRIAGGRTATETFYTSKVSLQKIETSWIILESHQI